MGGEDPLEYFVAGGIAGMVSRTCIAPIERVARKGQMNNYFSVLPDLLKSEGFFSLWKGNSTAVIRVVPYMSITFLSYEKYKSGIMDYTGWSRQTGGLWAGGLAGATATLITYPLDVIRAQLAMQLNGLAPPRYNGFLGAFPYYRQQGFSKLYVGLRPTLAGVAPYHGLKFFTYEMVRTKPLLTFQLKKAGEDLFGVTEENLGIVSRLAQTFVYPMDIIRRRMQTHQGKSSLNTHSGETPPYRSIWHGLTTIARTEGIKNGLYRGLTLNYAKTIPNVMIYMSLYDTLKHQMVNWKHS